MQQQANNRPGRADKLLVVFSDVEMGGGGVTDDFPQTDSLARLIQSYSQGNFHDIELDLIFNGDTFDFLKTSVSKEYPHYITAEIALAKLQSVALAHDVFFEPVQDFLQHRGAQRRVFFVAGNHDQELLFPEVQEAIRQLLEGEEQVVEIQGELGTEKEQKQCREEWEAQEEKEEAESS